MINEILEKDCISLDYSLAKWFVPRLKYFKEHRISHPSSLTSEEWDSVLEEIIEGFEAVVESDCWLSEIQHSKLQRSLELFGLWYLDLWS